ncbi:MAG: PAS domain S-box protein [Inquilinus sp.]|nr:PAS domain S-box protein [Inquilinus sp.]
MSIRNRTNRLLPRVLLRVLPVAVLVLVGVWYAASVVTERTVAAEVRGAIERDAARLADSLAAELHILTDAATALAGNDLIVNGLADTVERNNYLPTMFRSMRMPGPGGAAITLTDYRGRVIIDNGQGRSYENAPWFQAVMWGETITRIARDGMLIAAPVIYEGLPEGAIIVEFDARELASILAVGGQADAYFVVDQNYSVLYGSNPDLAQVGAALDAGQLVGWVRTIVAIPDTPGIALLVATAPERAMAPVVGVRGIALLALICTIGALTAGIVLTAYLTTRPLIEFASSIRGIGGAAHLSQRVKPRGSAEFRDLARSFNDMIERLQETTTSRDEFDNILNSMSEMLVAVDRSGCVRTVNRAACQLLSYDRDEMIGRQIGEFFLPPAENRGLINVRGRRLQGQRTSAETIAVTCTGKTIPILLSSTVMKGGDHTAAGAIYIALDISERKSAETELQKTQARLSTAIEAMSDGFALYDKEDRLALCNSRYREFYADSAEAIETGARFEDVIRHGAERGQYAEAVGRVEEFVQERVRLHRNPGDGTIEQQLNDGRWLRIQEQRTEDGGIVGLRTDISELKAREAELRRQTEALAKSNAELEREIERRMETAASLRESESRARAVFETAADGVVTIDEVGTIERINPAIEQMFGYSASELIGRNVSILMHPDERAAHPGYLKRYVDTGVARFIGETRELTAHRADGAELPIELTISEVRFGDQRLFTGIVRDITERKKIERIKDEFISTVSHELRTPMTSIMGALGLVAGGSVGTLPERAQSMIDIAYKNCHRLVRLLNDILDFERIGSGSAKFQIEPTAMAPMVKDAVEAIAAFAREHDVTIAVKRNPADVRVAADSDRLIQVLTNLLSNAVKFSPRGGSVEVKVFRRNGRVRVSVADHGPGIPEAFRGEAFERFSQADGSDRREKGGSGLGLSICKMIVDAHGGTINFDTELGVGTTFHFEVPEVREQAAKASAA